MRIKEARGIGPVAYKSVRIEFLVHITQRHTVIASDNCFASGVDHRLGSVEDHLLAEYELRVRRPAARRMQLRAASNILDPIQVLLNVIVAS